MRYLLDTNIISNLIKPVPSPALQAWMAARKDADLFVSVLTIGEIRRGILEKPVDRKREQLAAWFAGPEGPSFLFAGRILSFDQPCCMIWAQLMADGKAKGRPRSALDTMIAAIAQANEAVVVTDNEKDFMDIAIINPMRR